MLYFLFSCIGIVAALLMGIYHYRYLGVFRKIILLQVLLSFCTETAGHIISLWGATNNSIYNYYILLDFGLMCLAAFLMLKKKNRRRLLGITALAYFAVWLTLLLTRDAYYFLSWAYFIQSIILTILYLYLMLLLYLRKETQDSELPNIFIYSGTIIFYGCCVPYFGLFYILQLSHPGIDRELYDIILPTLSVIRYSLVAAGFYLANKKSSTGKEPQYG